MPLANTSSHKFNLEKIKKKSFHIFPFFIFIFFIYLFCCVWLQPSSGTYTHKKKYGTPSYRINVAIFINKQNWCDFKYQLPTPWKYFSFLPYSLSFCTPHPIRFRFLQFFFLFILFVTSRNTLLSTPVCSEHTSTLYNIWYRVL